MAFGQASGPPASAKQVRELADLLAAAGHDGFRDARGPMGFNQRQAAGKFTRDEAQTYIDQLEEAADEQPLASLPQRQPARPGPVAPTRPVAVRTAPILHLTPPQRAARALSDVDLLAEVRRRGLTTQP
jgi:hypothetical protein